eukprot:301366_1
MAQFLNQITKCLLKYQKRNALLFVIILLLITMKYKKRKRKKHNNTAWNYKLLKQMIKQNNISIPAMFIDLDVFEQNVKTLSSIAQKYNKTLRIATKSIRCPYLIQHAMRISNGTFKGLMCFSVHEANALVEYAINESKKQDKNDTFNFQEEFNDFLIAYPTIQRTDIEIAYKLSEKGIKISLMIDCVEHIRIIDEICNTLYCSSSTNISNGPMNKLNICIDLDMSYRIQIPFNLRFGAHRSNVYNEYDLYCILEAILQSKFLQLSGVMSYEAHVAGLPDNNPFSTMPNWLIRCFKNIFQNDCNKRRQELISFIQNKINIVINEGNKNNNLNSFKFINAGGTGNIHIVSKDKNITEVTSGSGLMQSKIFDYYIYTPCKPACAFALQITRISINEKYITCQSGGFIASGNISKDKQPVPFLPRKQIHGIFGDEGFGEVQTPLKVKDASIFNYGDAVFFRPAKAGEIAEHFTMYILKRGDKIEKKVETYRGMGYAFY